MLCALNVEIAFSDYRLLIERLLQSISLNLSKPIGQNLQI